MDINNDNGIEPDVRTDHEPSLSGVTAVNVAHATSSVRSDYI